MIERLHYAWKRAYPPPIVAAIPNGGSRNLFEAVRMKREGVLAGMPDLVICLPKGVTVWVEMKAAKGRISPHQTEIHSRLRILGHLLIVAHSADDALKQLKGAGVL